MSSIRGFSFVEIMVVVAVILALSVIAVLSLSAMSERLLLRSAVSDIGFALEATKARAVAGTGGTSHGVNFDDNVFTEFTGNSYDEDENSNVAHELDDRLLVTTDILDDEESIIFTRITGTVGDTVTVTVSLVSDPEKSRTIVVGSGGDISYGE